jgi:Prokaryotic RING finger family 1
MTTLFSCACGARLKLPETAAGRKFRCPACKQVVDPAAVVDVSARSLAGPASCPICQTIIGADEPVRTCPECQQAHHRDCWNEIGGCSIYGCPAAPVVEKEAPSEVPRAAWGDTKRCPACGEKIKAIALRCRYCDTDFDTVDPLTTKDLRRRARRTSELRSIQVVTIILFVAAITGCVAPLALLAGLIYFPLNWAKLGKAGPIFVVLAYATLSLAGLYSFLFVIFLIKGI